MNHAALVKLVFERDDLSNCIRMNRKAFPTLTPAKVQIANQVMAGVDGDPSAFSYPRSARPDDQIRLELDVDGEWLFWEGLLGDLSSTTPPSLFVSGVEHDGARGFLRVSGWVAGVPSNARVVLFMSGRELATAAIAKLRKDVHAAHPFIPVKCGFEVRAEVALPQALDTLELRLMVGTPGRVRALVAINAPDPIDRQPILPALRARARTMSRGRLESLLASDAFRRRWQKADEAHPCLIAREAAAVELGKRVKPGEEIAVRLTDGDLVLCCPADDHVLARRFLLDGHDELGFVRWLARQVGPGSLAIDAGGGYGVMSRTLAKRGARVVTIEADPVSADRIRRGGLFHGEGSIDVVEAALTERQGDVTFAGLGRSLAGSGKVIDDDGANAIDAFLSEISALDLLPISLLNRDVKERQLFDAGKVDVRRVRGITLDGLCEERSLKNVAILKMDIEGGELLALRGAMGVLSGRFGSPPIVAFEYSSLFPTRGGQREEILEMFFALKWTLWTLSGGKNKGGALSPIPDVQSGPVHDNVIALPPGRHAA